MPANSPQDKITVVCPHCGHTQSEPRGAFSTVCRKCREHIRLEDLPKATRKGAETRPEKRHIRCFECGAELEAPVSAQSTMCKRCSRYIDLKDYQIAGAVSKNFKTKGTFAVEPTGYVFNTEAIVGEAVIKGRFLGKLIAERSLTIHTGAEIRGTFTAGTLVIPAANYFRWAEPIRVGSAEIAGELTASLRTEGVVWLKSTARLFGDIEGGGLVMEAGAVMVGHARIGVKTQPGKPQIPPAAQKEKV